MALISVLLVDDDEDDYFLTTECLRDIREQQFEVTWAATTVLRETPSSSANARLDGKRIPADIRRLSIALRIPS